MPAVQEEVWVPLERRKRETSGAWDNVAVGNVRIDGVISIKCAGKRQGSLKSNV